MELGGSGHVGRMVLAAMEFDPCVRAAINLSYSEKVLLICKDMGLSISSFDRADEPAQASMASTMDGGVTNAIAKFSSFGLKKVPDIIYDTGGLGKEPMIRLFGKSAEEVACQAVKIARSYSSINDTDGHIGV